MINWTLSGLDKQVCQRSQVASVWHGMKGSKELEAGCTGTGLPSRLGNQRNRWRRTPDQEGHCRRKGQIVFCQAQSWGASEDCETSDIIPCATAASKSKSCLWSWMAPSCSQRRPQPLQHKMMMNLHSQKMPPSLPSLHGPLLVFANAILHKGEWTQSL